MSIKILKQVRFLSVLTCLLTFTTNAVFGSLAESHIWSDRRKSPHQKPQSALLQLAALPPIQSPLIQPRCHPTQISDWTAKSKFPTISNRPGSLTLPKNLLPTLISHYGTIRSVKTSPSGKPPHKWLIHIQDVHKNLEAQTNISGIIQKLIEEKAVNLIALEGSSRNIDIKPLKIYKNQDSIKAVSDYLLRENLISGAIHGGLLAKPSFISFVGVDDKTHYQENINAYLATKPIENLAKRQISEWETTLKSQKKSAFNLKLLEYDNDVELYNNNQKSLQDHISSLVSRADKTSPALQEYLELLGLEKTMNFSQVEAERTRLIQKLTQKLNSQDLRQLIDFTVQFRINTISSGDFYVFLQNLCERHQINLKEYPSMQNYLSYVLMAERIDIEALLKDVKMYQKARYAELAKTQLEKALIDETIQLRLTKKMLNFSLTPDEWQDYKNGGRSKAKDLQIPRSQWQTQKNINLLPFESFYREAEIRDLKLAENTLSLLKSENASAGVLVSGGFHAHGITDHLINSGVGVISVVPRLTKITDEAGEAYLSVFAQEKTPLQKLFEGEKLFLAQDPFAPHVQGLTFPSHILLLDSAKGRILTPGDWIALGGDPRFSAKHISGPKLTLTSPNGDNVVIRLGEDIPLLERMPIVTVTPRKAIPLGLMPWAPWTRMFLLMRPFRDLALKEVAWIGFIEELIVRFTMQGLLFPFLFTLLPLELGPWTSVVLYALLFATIFHWKIIDSEGNVKKGWRFIDRIFLFLLAFAIGFYWMTISPSLQTNIFSYSKLGLVHALYNGIVYYFGLPIPLGQMARHRKEKTLVIDPVDKAFVLQFQDRIDDMEKESHKTMLRRRFIDEWPYRRIAAELGLKGRDVPLLPRIKKAVQALKTIIASGRPSTRVLVLENRRKLKALVGEKTAHILRLRHIEGLTYDRIQKRLKLSDPAQSIHTVRKAEKVFLKALILEENSIPSLVVRYNDQLEKLVGPEHAKLLRLRYLEKKSFIAIKKLLQKGRSSIEKKTAINKVKTAEDALLRKLGLIEPTDEELVTENEELLDFLDPHSEHATVLRLRFLDGKLTFRQISKEIRRNVSNVSRVYATAMKRLRHRVLTDEPTDLEIVKTNLHLVDQLEPEHRDLLRLYFVEGKTRDEIAAAITPPGQVIPNAVSIGLRRDTAFRKLKDLMYIDGIKKRIDESLLVAIQAGVTLNNLSLQLADQTQLTNSTLTELPMEKDRMKSPTAAIEILDGIMEGRIHEVRVGTIHSDDSPEKTELTTQIAKRANKAYSSDRLRKNIRYEISSIDDWEQLVRMFDKKEGAISLRAVDITSPSRPELAKQQLSPLVNAIRTFERSNKGVQIVKHAIVDIAAEHTDESLFETIKVLKKLGFRRVWLRDRNGDLTPQQIRTFSKVVSQYSQNGGELAYVKVGWKFRDQKQGLAKMLVAMEQGINLFDAPMLGLGHPVGDMAFEDALTLLLALGSTRTSRLRLVLTTTRKLEGLLNRDAMAESTIWGLHRLTWRELEDVKKHLKKRLKEWRGLEQLIRKSFKNGPSNPPTNEDDDFTYRNIKDTSLVGMAVNDEITTNSVLLAEERLGALTPGFLFIRDNGTGKVVMEKTDSLEEKINEEWKAGNIQNVEKLLTKYYSLLLKIFKRGLINWNTHLSHFGVTRKGQVVLVNIGQLEDRNHFLQKVKSPLNNYAAQLGVPDSAPTELRTLSEKIKANWELDNGLKIRTLLTQTHSPTPHTKPRWSIFDHQNPKPIALVPFLPWAGWLQKSQWQMKSSQYWHAAVGGFVEEAGLRFVVQGIFFHFLIHISPWAPPPWIPIVIYALLFATVFHSKILTTDGQELSGRQLVHRSILFGLALILGYIGFLISGETSNFQFIPYLWLGLGHAWYNLFALFLDVGLPLGIIRHSQGKMLINPSDAEFVKKHQHRLEELENERYGFILKARFIDRKTITEIGHAIGHGTHSAMTHMLRVALKELRELVASGRPSMKKLVHDNQDRLESLIGNSYARALHRYYIDKKQQKDIAKEEGVGVAAITFRIKKGKEALLKSLGLFGPSDEELVEENIILLDYLGEKGLLGRILKLHFIEKLGPAEIGKKLKMKDFNVRWKIRAGLKELRQMALDPENSERIFVRSHQHLLDSLDAHYRIILKEHYIDDKSLSTLSRELKTPTSQISQSKEAGLKRLHELVTIEKVKARVSLTLQRAATAGIDISRIPKEAVSQVVLSDATLGTQAENTSGWETSLKSKVLDILMEGHMEISEVGPTSESKEVADYVAKHYSGRQRWKTIRFSLSGLEEWEKLVDKYKKTKRGIPIRGVSMTISIDNFQDIEKQITDTVKPTLAAIRDYESQKKIKIAKHVYLKFSIRQMRANYTDHEILTVIERLRKEGLRGIWLQETTGTITPQEIKTLSIKIKDETGLKLHSKKLSFGWRLKETGYGLIQMITALEEGIIWFETALGGIGNNIATEDTAMLLWGLGAPKKTSTEIFTRGARQIENFTQKNLMDNSSLWGLHRLPEQKILEEIASHITKQKEKWRLFYKYLRKLPRPPPTSQTNDPDFESVVALPGLPLTQKISSDETSIESIHLASSRLGDIVAGFTKIKSNQGLRIIVENTEPLSVVILRFFQNGEKEKAERLLKEYFITTNKIFERGLLNWNNKISDFGVNSQGRVVLVHFGTLEHARKYLANSGSPLNNFCEQLGFTQGSEPELIDLTKQFKTIFDLNDGTQALKKLTAHADRPSAVRSNWVLPLPEPSFYSSAALNWINIGTALVITLIFGTVYENIFMFLGILACSIAIHELAHWHEMGFSRIHSPQLLKGGWVRGGWGIPGSQGWPGVVSSLLLSAVSFSLISFYPNLSYIFFYSGIINLVFALSLGDWGDILNRTNPAKVPIQIEGARAKANFVPPIRFLSKTSDDDAGFSSMGPKHGIFKPIIHPFNIEKRYITEISSKGVIRLNKIFRSLLGTLPDQPLAEKTLPGSPFRIIHAPHRSQRHSAWKELKKEASCPLCGLLNRHKGRKLSVGHEFFAVKEEFPYFGPTATIVREEHSQPAIDPDFVKSTLQMLHEAGPLGYRIGYNHTGAGQRLEHQSYKLFTGPLPIENAPSTVFLDFDDLQIKHVQFPIKTYLIETKRVDRLYEELYRFEKLLEMMNISFNLLMSADKDGVMKVFIQLRSDISTPTSFPEKTFGMMEAGGIILFEDEKDFNDADLEKKLLKAYTEITPRQEEVDQLDYIYRAHAAVARYAASHNLEYEIDLSGQIFYVFSIPGISEVLKYYRYSNGGPSDDLYQRYFLDGYHLVTQRLGGSDFAPTQAIAIDNQARFSSHKPGQPIHYIVQKQVKGRSAEDRLKELLSQEHPKAEDLIQLFDQYFDYMGQLIKAGLFDIDRAKRFINVRGEGKLFGFDISHIREAHGQVNIWGNQGYAEDWEEDFNHGRDGLDDIFRKHPHLKEPLLSRFGGMFVWGQELQRLGIKIPESPHEEMTKPMDPWESKLINVEESKPTSALSWINILTSLVVLIIISTTPIFQIVHVEKVSPLYYALVLTGSAIIHELAHWAQVGFKWKSHPRLIKGFWHGGIGVPGSRGWPGLAVSYSITNLAGLFVLFEPYPSTILTPYFYPIVLFNLVFSLSITDVKDFFNRFGEKSIERKKLRSLAGALVTMAALTAHSPHAQAADVVNQALAQSTLNIGIATEISTITDNSSPSNNWFELMQKPEFPSILKQEMSGHLTKHPSLEKTQELMERLYQMGLSPKIVENIQLDIVVPYHGKESLPTIGLLAKKAQQAPSLTVLVETQNDQDEVENYFRSLAIKIDIKKTAQPVISGNRLILSLFEDNLPVHLKGKTGNVLLALPSGVEIDPSGLNPNSFATHIKVMVLNELLQNITVLSVTDQLTKQMMVHLLAEKHA